ncbi:hypothetical protein JCM19239_4921 [Vibrio variabilis]|uniref:Uncharacterized protein n=1 Tax=Vibrio variabilis TaxID=990271 RepID=A0ABQ0JBE2_9VIBR|nr:hypothetical protein JCM19239_4921 [Vibrio variabilis]
MTPNKLYFENSLEVTQHLPKQGFGITYGGRNLVPNFGDNMVLASMF